MMAIFTCCYNYVDAAQSEIHQHIVQMTAAKTRLQPPLQKHSMGQDNPKIIHDKRGK